MRVPCNNPADTAEFILMIQRKLGFGDLLQVKKEKKEKKSAACTENELSVFAWNLCGTAHRFVQNATNTSTSVESGVTSEDSNNC